MIGQVVRITGIGAGDTNISLAEFDGLMRDVPGMALHGEALRKQFTKMLALGCVLAVKVDGRIGALIGMYANDSENRTGHIIYLSVGSSLRRKGVGSLLIKESLLLAKTQGMSWVELLVKDDNQGAIALYERMGFAAVGIKRCEDRVMIRMRVGL